MLVYIKNENIAHRTPIGLQVFHTNEENTASPVLIPYINNTKFAVHTIYLSSDEVVEIQEPNKYVEDIKGEWDYLADNVASETVYEACASEPNEHSYKAYDYYKEIIKYFSEQAQELLSDYAQKDYDRKIAAAKEQGWDTELIKKHEYMFPYKA